MKPEKLKGHLELLLLAIVDDGPCHGYAVIQELRSRSAEVFDLPEGTIYPALHRLEKAGLVKSDWTDGDGRRRRVYSLTPAGHSTLEHQRTEWTTFESAVRQVLGGK
jgi:PadR family transcriptional regulator PadR